MIGGGPQVPTQPMGGGLLDMGMGMGMPQSNPNDLMGMGFGGGAPAQANPMGDLLGGGMQ